MFMRGDCNGESVDNTGDEYVQPWLEAVREIGPCQVMVYTIDRETPMKGLKKYTVEEMRALVQPLIDEGFELQIKG